MSRDPGSMQCKLNRHGAYFSINLEWTPEGLLGKGRDFAARCADKPPSFAPPNKYRKTPYGSKNQKTCFSGVSIETRQSAKTEGPATWNNVQHEDLFQLSRSESLYWQAVERRIVDHSENSALNFFAAAIRARSIKRGQPCRVFVSIIKRGLWS